MVCYAIRRVALWSASGMFLLAGCGKCGSESSTPHKPSTHAPTAALVDLDGQPVDLSPQNSAKVTVAIFTRTDCPIANRYAPEIRALHERFQSRNVSFCLIYVDPKQSTEAIRQHLQEFDLRCTALRDPKHAFATQCGATVTPEAAVFDATGTMTYLGRIDDRNTALGEQRTKPTAHDLADAIESTLQGRPIANPRTKVVGCLIADLAD